MANMTGATVISALRQSITWISWTLSACEPAHYNCVQIDISTAWKSFEDTKSMHIHFYHTLHWRSADLYVEGRGPGDALTNQVWANC